MGGQSNRTPRKDSWASFRPVGDDPQNQRKDSPLSLICTVMFFAILTITLAPLLCIFIIFAATGGRVFGAKSRVNRDKYTIFSDWESILGFIYAVVVWWATKFLSQPVRDQYGFNAGWLARFALACVAIAPVVWFMKRRQDERDRDEKAERERIQEAKRQMADRLLRRDDDEN